MRVSVSELLIILLIVSLIFGPRQIPKLTQVLGESIANFKSSLKSSDNEDKEDEEIQTDSTQE